MITDYIDKEREETKFTTEFLMLPCTAAGQTTSAYIAEKSNIWANQRLHEKKDQLDKKLYRNMIKINSDMLGLTLELTQMKKSSSTSSLDNFNVKNRLHGGKGGSTSGNNSPKVLSETRPASDTRGTAISRNGSNSGRAGSSRESSSPGSSKSDHEKPVHFRVGNDSSSDDGDNSDSNTPETSTATNKTKQQNRRGNGRQGKDLQRIISVTSCTTGRDCGANRAEFHSFQNATKRYTKQLSNH